jgi:hypothetical protein
MGSTGVREETEAERKEKWRETGRMCKGKTTHHVKTFTTKFSLSLFSCLMLHFAV